MKLLLKSSLIGCLLLYGQAAFGQNSTRNVYIGIDIFKNLPPLVKGYFFQKSLIIEPSVWIPLGYGGWHLNFTPGYSSIYANPVYKNLEYNNEGIFLKGGVNYLFMDYFSFGIVACASRYSEFGRYILEGPYYGGKEFPFQRRQVRVLGLETQAIIKFPLSKRFFLAFIARSGIHNLDRALSPESYYIPGMGVTSRDINITAGGSISLQYAIPLK
ncbi:hypothetical protein GXP67_10625 [Rhodocytophaga rosea]|uniref:Outer membrane beta-barrel protein n=1 Tax=Rhodocytophaga rosea TaxID=2704465 RepID=A0A6C0GGM5_9BACT|nr:hypothetical protein [Rhodocytophaga rosea]QHT67069.1 hypothetical protein GXP67_10625 [Rhodocytophaga rosea]